LVALVRYGLAIVGVGAVLAAGAYTEPTGHAASVFLLAAVSASAYFGGLGPSLVATVLSAFALDYFFFPPIHSITLGPPTWVWLAGYVGTAVLINWFQAAQRRATAVSSLANQRKSAFMAMLAHELRNFLSPVSTALTAIRLKAPDDPIVSEACDIAERQIRNMGGLIEELLDVARITQGKAKLDLQPVDLVAVLDAALAGAQPLIETRRHAVETAIPKGPLMLRGDARRLEQVFVNLLTNAAKYTEPGGRIWVTAEERDRQLVVRVRDNGRGLEPDVAPHIFELFIQGNGDVRGGLGIGLSLVKGLVELHGGRVAADSPGPGRGSEFVVLLPAAVGSSDAPEVEQGRPTGSQRL
jgi:signal transduction histidine kinase